MKKDKIFSLILVLLMMAAAAITVNKTIFKLPLNKPVTQSEQHETHTDSISRLSDGSIVIHTASLQGTIVGYAGPVPVDITIAEGQIKSVSPLENSETPGFFKRAVAICDSWTGKTPEEALAMKIDAVSGATFSSNAIISNVNAGLACYLGEEKRSAETMPWKLWIAFGVTLAACIVPLFVKSKIYHTVQMIANVIILGFWCGQFLDYSLMLKFFSQGFIWPAGIIAILMLVAAFIYPIFGRPQHYCNHICPLGSAQQLVAQCCGYKIKLSVKTIKALDWFRRILWAVLMLLLWMDCLTGWMDLELFQAFQFDSALWWIIAAACAFIALSAVISRPYCRFVCPTGSLFKRSENIG